MTLFLLFGLNFF